MNDIDVSLLLVLEDEWSDEEMRSEENELFKKRNVEGAYEILVRRHLLSNEDKFVEYFRLSPVLFDYVLNFIKDDIISTPYNRNLTPISPEQKLCLLLRITEETLGNEVTKNSHRLVFKREIQPFTPNIGPLRSLFNSGVRDEHLNQKRWISSSFGFGNKKKLRKGSEQTLRDVQKVNGECPTPAPDLEQEVRDNYSRGRMNLASKNDCVHREDDAVNPTSTIIGTVVNFGQQFELSGYPQGLDQPNRLFPTKSYIFEEQPFDNQIQRPFQNGPLPQQWEYHEHSQESKLSTTSQEKYVSAGGIYGDFHSTVWLSMNAKLDSCQLAKFTTETSFKRVVQPFTALHYSPIKMDIPFEELSQTGIKYLARPSLAGVDTMHSQYADSKSHQQFNMEGLSKYKLTSNKNIDDLECEYNYLTEKKNDFSKSERKLDAFDQISIPTVINSDPLAQLHHLEKPSKNIHGIRSMSTIKHEVITNVVPSVENHIKRKTTVLYDEGANYDMLPEEKGQYENNPLGLSLTKLQAKANKNNNIHFTAVARDSDRDAVKSFHRAGGSCGNCGGGVNISIMMATHPTLGSTVENSGTHVGRTTSAYDKKKKKKERKKNTNKNSVTILSEPVTSRRSKGIGYCKQDRVSIYRNKNDMTLTSKNFVKSFGQGTFFSNDLQKTNDRSKSQYRGIMAGSGKSFEAANNRMSYDSPNNSFSFQSYSNIVHKIQHPLPTVSELQTIGRVWEEQDDRDELQELYDEQNNTKAEENHMNFSAMPSSSYSRSTSSDNVKNLFFDKNTSNNASARMQIIENTNLGSKTLEHENNNKYPVQHKASIISSLRVQGNSEDLHEPWEKYAFPENNLVTNIHHKKSKDPISFSEQRKQKYLKPYRKTKEGKYYDQWEALDADLKNDFTEGCANEEAKVQLRNRKREVDEEDFDNDVQGYYRLSSGRSLRHPTNMIISAIRKGKMNRERKVLQYDRDRKLFQYEEMLGEEEDVTSEPAPVANTQN